MQEVFIVSGENKDKAEELLKKDETVNRGSINLQSPGSLDINEDGYFIILDCSEEGIKKAEELLKDIAKKYGKKKEVLEKIKEQEDTAIQGFGNIVK